MDMDSLKTNIKRFFSNPNTLTFILVIILIVIIYFVYNYMVERAISPVNVPYATSTINSKEKITKDLVNSVQITGNFITASGNGLIQNRNNIINKYVASGYQIPEGSFFYEDAIASESEQDKTDYTDLPDGYTIYSLAVDFHMTYGNSIMPGNFIDLYFKADDDSNITSNGSKAIIYEKFIKSIQVLSVKDSKGLDVFTEVDSSATEVKPATMTFAVPIEYYELLKKAEKINSGIQIIPVPRNAGYSSNPGNTEIVSSAVQEFIIEKSQNIDQ